VKDAEADREARLVAAAVNLAVDGTATEVLGDLQGAGVPCILLKGPALAEWLYGLDSTRFSVDVDLLVAPAQLGAAESVLGALGYVPLAPHVRASDRPRYARVWHRESGGVNVDLHTTLAGVGRSGDETWSVLSGETEEIELGRVRAQVLAPGARSLHVALHAAKHGSRAGKHLEDLRRALDLLPLDVWREAAALAVLLDAVPAFTTGLGLVPEGGELAGHLGLSADTSVEVALRAQTAPPLALGLEWFSTLPGPRAKARFVVGKLFPPAAFMRRWSPLARRGPLGLAAAYAYRPVWLLLKLGPALRTWRRAKKAGARAR
jgi:hypothetical protein